MSYMGTPAGSCASTSPPELQYNIDPNSYPFDYSSQDPSPSPTTTFSSNFDSLDFNLWPSISSAASTTLSPGPLFPSIEFVDLTSPAPTSNRRKRTSSKTSAEVITTTQMRRRAQNRASQRAFRQRKEHHVQELQQQLEELEAKYGSLERVNEGLGRSNEKLRKDLERARGQIRDLKRVKENEIAETLLDYNYEEGMFSKDFENRY